MAKDDLKAGPVYPVDSPALSGSDMDLPGALTVHGTTNSAPFPTLPGKWRAYLRRRLGRASTAAGVAAPLAQYLARAEQRADLVVAEVLQTTGRCGPIAETHADVGAKLVEIAKCMMEHADTTTKEGRKEVLLARATADTGLRALREAMNTSVIAAAMDTRSPVDPLDANMSELPDLEELSPE